MTVGHNVQPQSTTSRQIVKLYWAPNRARSIVENTACEFNSASGIKPPMPSNAPEFAELDRFTCADKTHDLYATPVREILSDMRHITSACAGHHGAWIAGHHGPPQVTRRLLDRLLNRDLAPGYTHCQRVLSDDIRREARRFPTSWNARIVFGDSESVVHGMTRQTKKEPMRCFAECKALNLPHLSLPERAAFCLDYIVDAFEFMGPECDVYIGSNPHDVAYFLPCGAKLTTAAYGAIVMPMRL